MTVQGTSRASTSTNQAPFKGSKFEQQKSEIEKCFDEYDYVKLKTIMLGIDDFSENKLYWNDVARELIELDLHRADSDTDAGPILDTTMHLIANSPELTQIPNGYLAYLISHVIEIKEKASAFLENFFLKYKVNFEKSVVIIQKNNTREEYLVNSPLITIFFQSYKHEEHINIFKLLFRNGAFTKEFRDTWRQTTKDEDGPTLYQVLLMLNEVELIEWIDSQLPTFHPKRKSSDSTDQENTTHAHQLKGLDYYDKKMSVFYKRGDFTLLNKTIRPRVSFDADRMGFEPKELANRDLALLILILQEEKPTKTQNDRLAHGGTLEHLLELIPKDHLVKLPKNLILKLCEFFIVQRFYDKLDDFLSGSDITRFPEILKNVESQLRVHLKTEESLEKVCTIKKVLRLIEKFNESERFVNIRSGIIKKLISEENYVKLKEVIGKIDSMSHYREVDHFVKELYTHYKNAKDSESETCSQIAACIRLILQKSQGVVKAADESASIFDLCIGNGDQIDIQELYQLLNAVEKVSASSKIYLNLAEASLNQPELVGKCLILLWAKDETGQAEQEIRPMLSRPDFCIQFIDSAVDLQQYAVVSAFLQYDTRKNYAGIMMLLYARYFSSPSQDQSHIRNCLHQLFSRGYRSPIANDLIASSLVEFYQPAHLKQLAEFLVTEKPDLNVDLGNHEVSLLPLALAVRLPGSIEERLQLIDLLLEGGALIEGLEKKTGKTAREIIQESDLGSFKISNKSKRGKQSIFTATNYKFWMTQKDLSELEKIPQNAFRKAEAREYEKNAQTKSSLLMLAAKHVNVKVCRLLIENQILPKTEVLQDIFNQLLEMRVFGEIVDEELRLVEMLEGDHLNNKYLSLYNIVVLFLQTNVDPKKLNYALQAKLMWFAVASSIYENMSKKTLLSTLFEKMGPNLHVLQTIQGEKITLFRWLLKKVKTSKFDEQITPVILEYGEKYPEPISEATPVQNPSVLSDQTLSEPVLSFVNFLNEKLKELEGITEITDLNERGIRFCFQDEKAYHHAHARFVSDLNRYTIVEETTPKDMKEESENAIYSLTVTIGKSLTLKNMRGFIAYWKKLNTKETYVQDFSHEAGTQTKGQPRNRPKVDRSIEVDENRLAKKREKAAKLKAEEERKSQQREKQKAERGQVKETEEDPSFIPPDSLSESSPTIGILEICPYGEVNPNPISASVSATASLESPQKTKVKTPSSILRERITRANDCLRDYQTLRKHPEYIANKTIWLQACSQYLMQACEALSPTMPKSASKQQEVDRLLEENVMPAIIFSNIRHVLRFNIKLTEKDLEELFVSFEQLEVKNSLKSFLEKKANSIKNTLWKNFEKCSHIQPFDVSHFSDDDLFAYIKQQKQFLLFIKQTVQDEIKAEISKSQSSRSEKNKFIQEKEHYLSAMRKTISNLQKAVVILEKRCEKRKLKIDADICKRVAWMKEKGTVNAHITPERLQKGGEKVRVSANLLWHNLMVNEAVIKQLDDWLIDVYKIITS